MKKFLFLIALVSLLALPANAAVGTVDNVPAGTLLLPYFEVDLGGGVDTLFSINNASSAPALAHVTIWTDWSQPVLDFDVYLTGYDVQTLSLANIIVGGNLPATGPDNDYSPQGPWSGPHDTFGGTCGASPGIPPVYAPIPGSIVAGVQGALTGQQVGGLCFGSDQGDNVARGYVTVDAVTQCSQTFPDEAAYWAGIADTAPFTANVLWGDFFIVDPANAFAQGFTLVHVEVDDTLTCPDAEATPSTFYCRYTQPAGNDFREALGSKYAVRWIGANDFFTGGTDLLVFRAPGEAIAPTCASPLALDQAAITVFDEEENPLEIFNPECPSSPFGGTECNPEEIPFPLEANRTAVGTDLFVGDFQFGWTFLNLNGSSTGTDAEKDQAYALAVMSADGLFSVGFDAIQLNNLTTMDDGPASLNPAAAGGGGR